MSEPSTRDDLIRLERLVADAMTARDPVAAFRAAAEDATLPAELRRAVRSANADGIRLSALLVAKLRFERLMQGSTRAAEWFASDPEAFSRAFRDYHEGTPPSERFPLQEGHLFDAWLDARVSS